MSSNPFAARIAQAAQEGYLPARRTYAHRTAPALPVAEAPATPRQLAFVGDLLAHRDFSGETRPAWLRRVTNLSNDTEAQHRLSREQASALIEYALGMPSKPVKPAEQGDIPAGRYAVEVDGVLVFAKVDAPVEGRWAGYTFVSQQVSDDFIRVNRRRQDEIKEAIRRDGFKEAIVRYGHELGVCGVCGRTLTNEDSREAGIGPVCAGKSGW